MPNYNPVIRQAARRYGINPKILRAQLKQESGLREGVRSSAGAQDIAQFIPSTARAYGVTLGDNRARDDIFGAAHYMADNLKRTGGDYRAALSIYNSGRPDAYKDPKFAGGQTFNYVRSILADAGGTSQVAPGRTAGPAMGPAYRTQTTPGIDNGPLRQQLKLQYLQNSHDPNALLQLATGLQNAQDTPSTTTRVRIGATARGRVGASGPHADGAVALMKAAAEKIDQAKVPYRWGGGHSGKQGRNSPVTALDCSGAVSRVLGIDPLVSGQLASWGKAGKGKRVTIYANGTHTLMELDGHVFGTSAENPGGGAGWIPKSYFPKGYFKNFQVRHPPGM